MAIITKTTYNYEYKCPQCGYLYSEHRGADESAFFTKCFTCAVNFELINQSETVVEEQIPDPVVTEEIIAEVVEEPVVE
jgi:uncharacterized protein (DUF983 family)